MLEQPTPAELKRFIEVFDTLDSFESQQRLIRGYGAFDTTKLPIPEVISTMVWLKQLAQQERPVYGPRETP